MNRKLAVGFASWRKRDDPMSRALSFFMNRELSRGWVGWHTNWSEIARKRAAMRHGLSHMLNRHLSRGWGAWTEMAVERAAFLQKLLQQPLQPQPQQPPQPQQQPQYTFFGGAGEELHTHSKKTIFLGETLEFLVQN